MSARPFTELTMTRHPSIERRAAIRRVAQVALTLALATLLACGHGSSAQANDPDTDLMNRGVAMLYRNGDPVGAEAVFREVLQRNPSHYGAQYQLAVALDRGGKPTDARPMWLAVLRNAQAVRDTTTIRVATTRLAAPDTASQGAMMALGLDLLYRQNNPAAAAEQFRKVLARNPTHYGATYQLATSLDRSGRRVEARGLWEKVLGMAEQYKDTKTIATAQARLK